MSSGYGYGAGWGGWGGYGYGGYYGGMGYGGVGVSTTTQQQIPMGNLIVVLVDTKLNEMVWRGNAKAEIAEDMQGRAQQLESAMNQMFYATSRRRRDSSRDRPSTERSRRCTRYRAPRRSTPAGRSSLEAPADRGARGSS